MYVGRIYEVKNKETGEWEAILSELPPVRSDIGYEDNYFSIDSSSYIYNKCETSEFSQKTQERLIHLKEEYGPNYWYGPCSFTLKDLFDIYDEKRRDKIKEVSMCLASEAYTFFNSKLDKLLMWAAKDIKPKLSKKEIATIDRQWDDNGWADMQISDLLYELNPFTKEFARFYTISDLSGNRYCLPENIRVVFFYYD